MDDVRTYQTDVVIVGGGMAGIVAADELLRLGHRVLLIDKDTRERFGGLARQSSGGVFLVDSPNQRRLGIRDSVELAWRDWQSVAEYEDGDVWGRQWGRFICENTRELVFDYLHPRNVRFLPVVNWAERGLYAPGNTVPRWHMTWGLGAELVGRCVNALSTNARSARLTTLFETEVNDIEVTNGTVTGVRGRAVDNRSEIRVRADLVIIATGGICGGDLSRLRAHWYKPWGKPPETLLNGAHRFADGMLHDRAAAHGAALTNLDLQWHYPAGVHYRSSERPANGLSLVPPRSALWFNALGERIMNPGPLIVQSDTRHLVASVLGQPGQYTWLILNSKIAVRELTASGTEYLTPIRRKSWRQLVATLVFGNPHDTARLLADCSEDMIVAKTFEEMVTRMTERSAPGLTPDAARIYETIRAWDDMIRRGPRYHNDDQLRRIADARQYRGDRVRTCNFQTILDPAARPLIAIRCFVLARKSLGGIQTDLQCRVLRANGDGSIPGLYAIGEAAGFGGGGAHGKGSLEGTFLAGCVLTARQAARTIGTNQPIVRQPDVADRYNGASPATAR